MSSIESIFFMLIYRWAIYSDMYISHLSAEKYSIENIARIFMYLIDLYDSGLYREEEISWCIVHRFSEYRERRESVMLCRIEVLYQSILTPFEILSDIRAHRIRELIIDGLSGMMDGAGAYRFEEFLRILDSEEYDRVFWWLFEELQTCIHRLRTRIIEVP